MATLYVWLRFVHILGVGGFLFVHGIAGGAGFILRQPVTASTRFLLRISQFTGQASYPLLLLVVVTGIWMAFAQNWARQVWPWAALVILVATTGFMGYIARPYYKAREAAAKGADDAVAAELAGARPELAGAVGTVAIVLILALMVFKPF